MLDIYFFNVGHGDSIAINFPDNTWGVIDCNKGSNQEEPNVLAFLKKINVNSLRFLCLTHPHDDHCNGMDKIFAHYQEKVGQYYTYAIRVHKPSESRNSDPLCKVIKSFHSILKKLQAKGTHKSFIKQLRNTQEPIVIGDVKIEVLNPSEILMHSIISGSVIKNESDYNKASIVFRLTYKGINIIFGADATATNWNEIIKEAENNSAGRLLQSNVLKVSHHGSRYNNSDKILKALTYKNNCIAIISTDGGIRYSNLPDENVIEYLNNRGVKVFRTDSLGFNLVDMKEVPDLGQEKLTESGVELFTTAEPEHVYDGFIKLSINENREIKIEEIETISENF